MGTFKPALLAVIALVMSGCLSSTYDLSAVREPVYPVRPGHFVLNRSTDAPPLLGQAFDLSFDGANYRLDEREQKILAKAFFLPTNRLESGFIMELAGLDGAEKKPQTYVFVEADPAGDTLKFFKLSDPARLPAAVRSELDGLTIKDPQKTAFVLDEIVRNRSELRPLADVDEYRLARPFADLRPKPAAGEGADTRVALVIGNSDYESAAPLQNPRRDAAAVAETLRRIGFTDVQVVDDASHQAMINALKTFSHKSAAADWSLLYFAGHGIEVNHTDYLIPTDAKLSVDTDVQYEAVSADQAIDATGGARKIRIVILDACRENPFAKKMAWGSQTRSVARGLAPIAEPGTGTLVVFAARDGQLSFDGDGDHSPFVSALLKELATPHLEIRRLFDLVRDDVMDATGGKQQPFTYGSVSGRQDFYFRP